MKRRKEPTLKSVMKKAMDEDLQTALALSRSMVEASKREKAAAKRAAKECAPLNLLVTEEQRDNLIGQRLSRLLFAEIPPSQLQPPPIATELPGVSWTLAAACEPPEAYYVSALQPPIEPCAVREGDRMLPLSQIPGRDRTCLKEEVEVKAEEKIEEEEEEEEEEKKTEDTCGPSRTESGPLRSTDLRANLLAMVGSELCSDASFLLQGGRVPCHRFVLAARCPNLLQLLDGEGRIEASGVPRDALLRFLRFLYAERAEKEGSAAVLELFDRWNLDSLKAAFLSAAAEEVGEESPPSYPNPSASLLPDTSSPPKHASDSKSPPQDLGPPHHPFALPLTSPEYSAMSPPYLPTPSISNQHTTSPKKLSICAITSPNQLITSTNIQDPFPTHLLPASPDKLPTPAFTDDFPTPSPHRPLPSPYHHFHSPAAPSLSPPLQPLPSPSPPAPHFSPPTAATPHFSPPQTHVPSTSSAPLPPSNSPTKSPPPSERSIVVLDSDSDSEPESAKAPIVAMPKISEAVLDAAIDKLDAIGLRNELTFYGVRELPRKQAVRVLKAILLEVCRDQLNATPRTCSPKKSPPKKARKKTYASSAEVVEFVKSDNELYEKIIRYEPVELDFVKSRLRAADVKVKNEELIAFLDDQSITFVNNKEDK